MSLYTAIDLHSNNLYLGIVDKMGTRLLDRRIPNDLDTVLKLLARFEGVDHIVVESTYNWYWLVDGLAEHGYQLHLANPAAIEPYSGLKDANDRSDTFFLAELLGLGILPEGYIYPKEERPVRDLLRRRMKLVQQRTAHLLSFKGLLSRETGSTMKARDVCSLQVEEVGQIYDEKHNILMGEINIAMIQFINQQISRLEKTAQDTVKLRPEYALLKTVPGIGPILSLVIMLETGNISRFAGAGNYASYCRCVKAQHTTNHKKKRENNRKNGNKYLGWAYVEAAHHALRSSEAARSFYQRKKAKAGPAVATKALACKLSKACYFILRDQTSFNYQKCFQGYAGEPV